jgi:pyruvate/2-oxoglutarate dehydrogenase complex dihydrolipoamide acyltransferase (E2) component
MTPVLVMAGDLSGADGQASVGNWFFDDQAIVRAGDLLCEVMVDKVILEVRSPAAGRLRIQAPTETLVTPETVLAQIE